MAQHHKFSASGAEGWMNCYGKLVMEKNLPNTTSTFADQGSAAHYLAADCLLQNTNPEPSSTEIICWVHPDIGSGQTYSTSTIPEGATETSRWEIDDEMCEHVQGFIDYVRAHSGELFVEQKVEFGPYIGLDDAFGTADTVIIDEDIMVVIDLKYGHKPVDAENNYQLQLYALGALNSMEPVIGEIDAFKLVIYQPRIDNISEWVISVEELNEFKLKAEKAVEMALKAASAPVNEAWKNKYLKPTDKGCLWCKAKAYCSAYQSYTMNSVPAYFPSPDDFENLDEAEVMEKALDVLPTIPFANLARVYGALDRFEEFIEAVRSRMLRELVEGERHPDYKLVRGRAGHRIWTNEEEVDKLLKPLKNQRYITKLISPAQSEKLLKKHPEVWNSLAKYIEQSEGKIVVAPSKDKRPAIDPYSERLTGLELI